MKTRSGRVVTGAAADTHDDVGVSMDVKPRARARVSSRSSTKVDKVAGPAPVVVEQNDGEQDMRAADVFKVVSPVKVVSSRPQPRTPRVTATVPTQVEVVPEPKSLLTSPLKSTMTRARSNKDLVESVSHIPLPDDSMDDAEVQQQHSARQRYPSTPHSTAYEARKHSNSRLWIWVAFLTLITCGAAVLAYTTACHGWPTPVQLPPERVQPVCRELHATWLRVEEQSTSAFHHAQVTAAAWQAQAQQHATKLQQQARVQLSVAAAKLHLLKQQLAFLLPVPPHPTSSFADVLPADALRPLVVQSAGSIDVQDVYLQAHTHQQSHHKAPGILIACGAACDELQQAILSAVQSQQHVLVIDGAHPPASAGALQQQLAAFLHATPTGLVVLRHLGHLDAASLSVINNALSEMGSLQLNGRTVGTGSALFLALLPTSVSVVDDATQAAVKSELQADVAAGVAAQQDGEQAQTLARALRRRFEHALVTPAAVVPAPVADAHTAADSDDSVYVADQQ